MFCVFQLIKSLYSSGNEKLSDSKIMLFLSRVARLERCIRVDLCLRITRQDHRIPLYIDRTISVLNRAKQMFTTPVNSNDCIHSHFGDLSAELLAVILDHGFCGSVNTVDMDEASLRINQMKCKLSSAGSCLDTAESLSILQHVIAEQWGLNYAVSADSLQDLEGKMEDLDSLISNIETQASTKLLNLKSESIKQYIDQANFNSKLSPAVVDGRYSHKIMTNHTSHSATCEWLFERLDSWIEKSECQIFLLSGRAGSGKSAFASSVCKKYPKEVVASFAFDKSAGNEYNTVTNMICVLAKELTESLPEYSAAIEKIKGTPIDVIVKKGWRNMYEAFMEDPLTDIYGSQPRTPRSPQRHPETYSHKVIVIDAIDECLQTEWEQLKQFLSEFSSNIHPRLGLLLTVRNKYQSMLIPLPNENINSISLESRSLSGRHLKDVELYIAGCLGVLLSDEDDAGYLDHARTDAMTLQDTVDELLKASAGRFVFYSFIFICN